MLNRDPKVCARHLTKAELKQVALYADEFGQVRTAAEFNIATTTVRRALRLHKLKPWRNGRPKSYTEEERQAWRDYGKSRNQTAEHFGVARSTISHALGYTTPRQR